MMKKILALVLVLALAAGVVAMSATAATSEDIDYRVGYSKVDINPYWSIWEAAGGTIPTDLENYEYDQNSNLISSDHIMPMPMGGYGGNAHRLSRPELIDDNGSGVHADDVIYLTSNRYTEDFAKEMLGEGTTAYTAYAAGGFGQNDGDGIYATCVSIRQNASAEPVLMFSVDLIGVAETYVGQAKNVIIRELKNNGVEISPDRILINATHTHGAISLGESFDDDTIYYQKLWGNTATVPFPGSNLDSYLNAYRKHLYAQLAAAAVQALTDGNSNGTVVMEKGTIDVSDATGYQLNGVRHRKAQLTTTDGDGNEVTVDYVTGSSFNVDLEGEEEICGVSESDDRMHVLQFSFPDASVDPILMVNWRAHTTANNKMNTKAHNNLSADFVAPMRTQLEQWGYRFILNYSTSGNLGMGDQPETYNISTSATATTMNATKYGQTLAFAAAYLADPDNSAVSSYRTTLLTTLQSSFGSTYSNQVANYAWPALTECTQGEILLETTYYDVAYQTATDAQYQAALYHNDLAVEEGGSASNDGGLKLEITGYPFVVKAGTYTANGNTYTIAEDVVIASQYHANSLKKKHGTINAKRISLCAFMLGDQVAFATMPFEASDRYSASATLDTANNYNDWNDLVNDSKWGTPFLMSLTNGSEGYVPNYLAYTYTKDLEAAHLNGEITQAFVSGSYEAHTAYSAAGEGENIVAALNTLLWGLAENGETAPTTKTGYCEACDATVTWTALNDKVVEDNSMSLASGHYYLAQDYTTKFGVAMVYLDETVCLDLNGHTYYSSTNTGTSRVFNLYGTLNVMDSVGTGVMQGKMAGASNGGTVLVSALGTLNLYSGTLTCDTSGDGTVTNGGVVYVSTNGTFNMYDGAVTGGKVSSYGGNISVQHSGEVGATFNMYGGSVTGGSAGSASYANLMVSAHSFFRYIGGSIPSGAFMQGTMYLGSHTLHDASTDTATVLIRNACTVTLDGVFTGKVNLDYTNTKNEDYSASPASGDTIGAVTPGSWIDYVNGAQINATNTSDYEGVVDGELLKLGTAPTSFGYCNVCKETVYWVDLGSNVFYGHYALNGTLSDMGETTVLAGNPVCLDLKGNTYTASARAFTVNGTLDIQDTGSGGTLQGTAVEGKNGGTILVNAGGAVNHHSGTLTCDHATQTVKISKGGVVYVAADGSYTLNGGTLTGGYAANGGNMYVVAGAEFVLDDGTITEGNATTGGGNVYTYGAFTMNGGSISGGTATSYGGNVHVQGASAVFTMTGGTVSGGTGSSNICTGPNATNNTSTFRMEGGSVIGDVYVQGKAVLTGTTTGTVNITSKVPAERLTIEGTYTGTLNLKVHSVTSFAVGDKIGNATNDADISGATITVTDAEDTQYVEIVGNELRMGGITGISVDTTNAKTTYAPGEALDTTGLVVYQEYSNGNKEAITNYEVTGYDSETTGTQTVTVTYGDYTTTFEVTVAEVDYLCYVNGVGYTDLEEAMAASSEEYPVVLNADVNSMTLSKDLYLDLKGFDVTSVTTGSYKLYCLDSATDDFEATEDECGKAPVGENILAYNDYRTTTDDAWDMVGNSNTGKKYYLAIADGNGMQSFHRLQMEIYAVNVDTTDYALSYTAYFKADSVVKSQIKEFGIAMRAYAQPNQTSIWADTDQLTHYAMAQSEWMNGTQGVKGVRVTNILSDSATNNDVRAKVEIYGRCYIQFTDDTMLFSPSINYSMKTCMEYPVEAAFDTLEADEKNLLAALYEKYESFMSGWNCPNLKDYYENDYASAS